MTATEFYDLLRHLADSWGLMAMFACFVVLVAWPYRPGAGVANDAAAHSIFEDEDALAVVFVDKDTCSGLCGQRQ